MSPSRVPLLPSPAALASYNISSNGFLPATTPLSHLPHKYYEPWEILISQISSLIAEQKIRQVVNDSTPILSTEHLASEAEWQRAYSLLAVVAQAYIWAGPEPEEVSQKERKKERINYSKDSFFANSALLFLLCTASPTTDFDPISRDSRTSTSPTHRDLRGAEPLELATIERM